MMRRLAFKTFHALRPGDDLLSRWTAAEALQWADAGRLRDHQEERLAALLRHAAVHVPRYRELIGGESEADLARLAAGEGWSELPMLDKSILRSSPEDCVTGDPSVTRLPNATSGSTGESLRFYLDGASRSDRAVSTHRFHRWAGIEPWDRHAKLWGARFDAPDRGLRQRLTAYLHPMLFLSSYEMSEATVKQYIERLIAFQPRALTSYPSPLEHFARAWPSADRDLEELRAIICSAEQMSDDQRSLFESTFACPVYDRYGSREFGNIAQECEVHDGLHVAADRLFIEIVDDAGAPVPDGEPGEVLITDLGNRAMPFIRYRTGDRSRWATAPCPCGRTLPRLQRVEGRVLELVRIPGGGAISGTFWPQILKQASPRVRFFQVVQDREDEITIRLVMEPPGALEEDERQAVLRRIAERAEGLGVAFEYVDDIPLTPGGKRRMVIGMPPPREER